MKPSTFVGSRMMRTAAPQGYGLLFVVNDVQEAHAEFVFDDWREGPPGFAHGGAVAAVLDEAMGTACFEAGRGGFTATMTVNYRQSAPLNTLLQVVGRVESSERNKTFASAVMTNSAGEIIADATGLFIISERLRGLMVPNSQKSVINGL